MSIRTRARRAAALVAGGALVAGLGAGIAGPVPQAHAAETPAPEATAAAAWLQAQVTDGLLSGDVGRTMDLGLSLLASDTSTPALLTTINTGIQGGADDFVTANFAPKAARAKLAYYYQLVGLDASAYLTQTATDTDDTTGQIDGGTPYTQAWAALALRQANHGEAEKSMGALVATQCANGAWTWDPECNVLDPDITAIATLALLQFDTSPTATTAADKAVAWMKSAQRFDGAVEANSTYNTNSTGLVAWALGDAGETAAAAKSAAWVAGRQLVKLGGCASVLDPEAGAVAYDDQAIIDARTDGEIAGPDRSQWTLASAQSLAGLAYLGDPAAGKITVPTTYVRGGTNLSVKLTGVRAGQPVCLSGMGPAKRLAGPQTTVIKLPTATVTRVLTLRWLNGSTTATVKVLGAKTLRPRVAKTSVVRGGLQTVTTTGLAPGERFTVRYAGRTVRSSVATSTGVARATFRVGRVKGLKSVLVLGQFSNRRGTATFRVR